MKEYIVHMILLRPGGGSDRKDLERIEDCQFNSKEAVESILGGECTILSASEFMDWINDQDDDMEISERFKPEDWFIGYVHIEK
jgi:hypothetical protein